MTNAGSRSRSAGAYATCCSIIIDSKIKNRENSSFIIVGRSPYDSFASMENKIVIQP